MFLSCPYTRPGYKTSCTINVVHLDCLHEFYYTGLTMSTPEQPIQLPQVQFRELVLRRALESER
jgi:hypothetical protein